MTGEQKLAYIDKQFHLARNHGRKKIICPYCKVSFGFSSVPEYWVRSYVSPYCCKDMDDACMAIAQRIVLRPQIEMNQKIGEAIASGKAQQAPKVYIN